MKQAPLVTDPPNRLFLGGISLVASLGGVLFGYDTAVISGTFSLVETFFDLSKIEVGWFASSALVGAILGAAVAGSWSDRYGRKPVLLVSALLFFISALFCALPVSFTWLIAARLLGGIGVGVASVLSPLYISEIAPPEIRGRLVAFYQLSIVIGILFAYFVNWLLLDYSTGQSGSSLGIFQDMLRDNVWRGMFGSEMVPAGLFFLALIFIPESPRWLIKNHRAEAGLQILTRISGSVRAKSELEEIRSTLHQLEGKLIELFRPGLRKAIILGIGLSVFGQFTGVNIVVYYGPSILEDAGFGLDSALQFQVAIGLINFLFTILALWKIDQWGRRPLLLYGMTAVCISLLIIAFQFLIGQTSGLLIVVLLCLYMAGLALSINAVIWVLLGEIYPTRIRGRAMGIATFANWTTNFLTAFLFPWYVAATGMHVGFFTFAISCFIAILFFYKLVPETKGKSLEEIERYWDRVK